MEIKKKKEFNDKQPIIDQILDQYGYRYKTWIKISIFLALVVVDGLVMTLFNNIIIPFDIFYNLSNINLQIVSGILFVGVGLGSMSTGWMASMFMRHNSLRVCFLFLCIFYFLLGWSQNIFLFAILRFMVGFFNGILIPIGQNLLAEYLPIKNRAMVLTSIWIGFGVGSLLFNFIQFQMMPNLEASQLNNTLLLSAIIPAALYIYVFFLVNDSPRHFILKDQENEAFKILEDLNEEPLDDRTRAKIIDEVKKSVVTGQPENKFTQIYQDKYLRTTVLLSILWAIFSILNYGPGVISSITMAALGEEVKKTNNQVLVNLTILTAVNTGVPIIGGFLSEVPTLGRKMSMIVGLSFGILFVLLCCIFPGQFSIFLGLAIGFFTVPFNIIGAYSSEIYPTKIRDFAVGYMYCCTRMGGVLSQFIYIGMSTAYIFLPYYFSAFLGIVCIVMIYFLPYETHGAPLDHDHSKHLTDETVALVDKEE